MFFLLDFIFGALFYNNFKTEAFDNKIEYSITFIVVRILLLCYSARCQKIRTKI